MSELPTFEGDLTSLPATILKILKLEPPDYIPPPIDAVTKLFENVERIILVMIDNLGLFEITYYKPAFLIQQVDALVLFSTKNPYTLAVFHQLMHGELVQDMARYKRPKFHLLDYLNQAGMDTVFIGRERDIRRYKSESPAIAKRDDMATWIEAAKAINRHNLSLIHFLDFETLYRRRADAPEELIDRLIKRTDKWLSSLYKQARKRTLMLILGNHGRRPIDLKYQGRIAQWRKASVPVGLLSYKEK
ncbi:MAG: hypothetical protein ACTSU2_04620 [Promethearchaeota archaeon]